MLMRGWIKAKRSSQNCYGCMRVYVHGTAGNVTIQTTAVPHYKLYIGIAEQRQRRITNYISALPNNGSAALQTIDRHCRDFLHVSAMPRCKNCRQCRQQSHTLALPDHSWVIITHRKHDTLCILHKIIFNMNTDIARCDKRRITSVDTSCATKSAKIVIQRPLRQLHRAID